MFDKQKYDRVIVVKCIYPDNTGGIKFRTIYTGAVYGWYSNGAF